MSSSSRRANGAGNAKASNGVHQAGGTIPSAVPFIQMNEKGQFFVHEQSVQLFSHIKGKICPIVVAGPYRTGKSTLLNLLLGQQVRSGSASGFQVGGTIQACTKGMWVWGEPIYNAETDCSYIFIDSEGLNSTDQTGTFDTQIFSLSILLSSLFILNTQGTINEQALEQLELVLEMTKKVKVNESKAATNQQDMQSVLNELSSCFPSFLWVLRDFTLNLVDKNGATITPSQYLESALVQQVIPAHLSEHKKQGMEEKNRVRQSISSLFRQRDCMTLIRPVVDEKDLSSNISTLDSQKIRPEFVHQMSTLRERVFQWAQPKQIDHVGNRSIALNASAFVNLAKTYVEAMNTGTVPVIKSAFTAVRELSAKEAMERAYSYLTQHLQEIDRNKAILDDSGVNQLNVDLLHHIKALVTEHSIGDVEYKDEVFTFFKKDKFDSIWAQFVDRNNDKCLSSSRALIQQIWTSLSFESHLSQYQTAAALEADWARVKRDYEQAARGPAQLKNAALNEFLEAKLAVVLRNLFEQAQQLKQNLQDTQQKLTQKEQDEKKWIAQYEESKKNFEMTKFTLETELKQAHKENKQLAQQAEKQSSQLQASQAEITQLKVLNSERASSVSHLESQLQARRAEYERLQQQQQQTESELNRIKVEGAARLKELEVGLKQAEKERLTIEEEVAKATQECASLEKRNKQAEAVWTERIAQERTSLEARLSQAQRETMQQQSQLQQEHAAQLAALQQKLAGESEVASRVKSVQEKLEDLKKKQKVLQTENDTLKQRLEQATLQENSLKQQLQQAHAQAQAAQAQAQAQAQAAAVEPVNKWGAPQPPQFNAGAGAGASTGRGRKSKVVEPQPEPEYEVPEAFHDDDDDDEEEKKAPAKGASKAKGKAAPAPAPSPAPAPAPKRAKAAAKPEPVHEPEPEPAAQAMSDDEASVSEASQSGSEEESEEEERRPRLAKKRQSLIYRHLPDPSKESIQALKSWLTSLDVELPVRAQPKSFYLDLLYEHQEGLEQKWPRKAAAAKKAKK